MRGRLEELSDNVCVQREYGLTQGRSRASITRVSTSSSSQSTECVVLRCCPPSQGFSCSFTNDTEGHACICCQIAACWSWASQRVFGADLKVNRPAIDAGASVQHILRSSTASRLYGTRTATECSMGSFLSSLQDAAHHHQLSHLPSRMHLMSEVKCLPQDNDGLLSCTTSQ